MNIFFTLGLELINATVTHKHPSHSIHLSYLIRKG